MEIKIVKLKGKNACNVTIKGLTAGMVMAIQNALTNYPQSPVAQDVKGFLDGAVERCPELKAVMDGTASPFA